MDGKSIGALVVASTLAVGAAGATIDRFFLMHPPTQSPPKQASTEVPSKVYDDLPVSYGVPKDGVPWPLTFSKDGKIVKLQFYYRGLDSHGNAKVEVDGRQFVLENGGDYTFPEPTRISDELVMSVLGYNQFRKDPRGKLVFQIDRPFDNK